MKMTRKILVILLSLSFFGAAFLLAQEQSLVELAKKEKERRESLKGKQVRVVTNQDLENLTKTPALTLPPQESTSTGFVGELPSTSDRPVVHRVTVEPPRSQNLKETGTETYSQDISGSTLEEAWKKAKEYVELLTLKMNALWAEFYGMQDMKSRDYLQQQISETYEKLLKAQEEEARLRMEYESQVNRKRSESASPIWIR